MIATICWVSKFYQGTHQAFLYMKKLHLAFIARLINTPVVQRKKKCDSLSSWNLSMIRKLVDSEERFQTQVVLTLIYILSYTTVPT